MSDPALGGDCPAPHPYKPAVRFDGGDLDCGSGLLLQIRRRIDPLTVGELLEIRSSEPSVAVDLPAWCRMTGNELVSIWHDHERGFWGFLVSKSRFDPALAQSAGAGFSEAKCPEMEPEFPGDERPGGISRPGQGRATVIAPLSVMGIGSWPRPDWLLQALHEHLEGRLGDREFQSIQEIITRADAPSPCSDRTGSCSIPTAVSPPSPTARSAPLKLPGQSSPVSSRRAALSVNATAWGHLAMIEPPASAKSSAASV